MKEFLEAHGWRKFYECLTCGHKMHFDNPAFKGYEIRIRVKRNNFTIALANMVIAGPFAKYQLEEKLKKYNLL